MMSEIKLKPCPHCWSENITEGSRMFDFGEDIYIACKDCGAKIQIAKEYGWDDLRKRWNRRMSKELEIESAQRRLKEAEYSRDYAIKQLILSDKEIDKWKKIIEELTEINKK